MHLFMAFLEIWQRKNNFERLFKKLVYNAYNFTRRLGFSFLGKENQVESLAQTP